MRTTPLLLALMLLAPPAYALAPGERAIFLEGTGGIAVHPGRRLGLGGGLSFSQGMTDTVALRIGAESAWFPANSGEGGYVASHLVAGATFAFDALAYIPFAELSGTFSDQRTSHTASQWVGIQAGLGMDYLLSRHTGLGVVLRSSLPIFRLAGDEGTGRNVPLLMALRIARYF